MLVKPLAGPSTTYMTVPMTTTTSNTKLRKTKILRRLAASARPSAAYSATYSASFRIRNRRSSRSSRTSINACRPGMNRASQVGSTASTSMMPNALRAYLNGRRTHTSRAMYSAVNSSVNTHSSTVKSSPQVRCNCSKLSSMTTVTLARIIQTRARSNKRPARVSASKMMVYSRSRQPPSGRP